MEKMSLQPNFLFADHVVLQREKEISVWGCAAKGAEVSVSLRDATGIVLCENTTSADSEGKWMVKLPSQPAMREAVLRIVSGKEEIYIHDVAVGEVWIAAGQSNMEFAMRYDADYKKEVESCANADIRFFDTPRICYEGQLEDFDYREYGCWKTCNAGHLEYYSAVGYYFAKELQKELGVPVGIVGCNRGGSIAAAWMERESLGMHGRVWLEEYAAYTPEVYRAELEKYRNSPGANSAEPFADVFSDELMYGMSREKQLELMAHMPTGESETQMLPPFNNYPECLWQYMLKIIIPYTARGILWYQGESDCIHPECYGELFLDMVQLWRNAWKEQLPFLTVQLAPFGQWLMCEGDNFPQIREQQESAAKQGKDIYLVSSSDSGMQYDIHPKKKAPIGYRLALCAEAEIYGRAVEWEAPIGAAAEYQDGELRIVFQNGEGLRIERNGLHALTVMRGDEIVYSTDAELASGCPVSAVCEGNILAVKGLEFLEEGDYRVVFAQNPYYEVNLYNRAGIPAMPFTCPICFRL